MTEKQTRKYAVVDLEATSASVAASIIQVGIVIIENDEITQTFQTDINPHEELSEHIVQLTGITDEQLAQAPEFSQVARHIFEMIEDCIFVAHNVKFDANLLAEHLFFEGFELRTPRVDTVELSQVFYPTFEKYSLGDLSNLLDLDLSDAHTAIADAMATAHLFLKLKRKMQFLPKQTLERILSLSESLLFETSLVIEEAFHNSQLSSFSDYQEVAGIVLKKDSILSEQRHLFDDFTFNLALLGLDAREKQVRFANLVQESFLDSSVSFLEAQAGLGKTYGYLLPLLGAVPDEQIIVSVPTKILQDQIMANEVKHIQDVFHISCQSIKGPRNYIKLDAFYESLHRQGDNRLVNRYKMQVLVWLTETLTGDLDEIKQKQRYEIYFDSIKHDGDLSQLSLFKDADFWHRTYEKAKQSQLIVINHAYFLERVQDDKAFAEKKVLVFDEAQKLILNLDQFSRRRINLTKLIQGLERHLDSNLPLLEKRLIENLSFELSHSIEMFYKNKSEQLAFSQVDKFENMIAEMQSIIPDLRSLGMEELCDLFTHTFTQYWFEADFENEKRVTYLNAASDSLLNFQEFLPETRKTYMISATLQVSSQVSVADLLGFSSFSFASIEKEKTDKQRLWIDSDMPLIKQVSDSQYTQETVTRLVNLLQLKRPILTLFNSKKAMFMVSELLDDLHINHLTQEKNGTAYNVKRRFDRGESLLLLGTGSFWEGVDFFNADQMIEVITRLPFENPEDRFVKKIYHHLQKEGKNPFQDYSLPLTILKLKQAIGRTVRRENQRSAILILDKRILTETYGAMIYEALDEEFYLSSQKFPNCLTEIDNFLL